MSKLENAVPGYKILAIEPYLRSYAHAFIEKVCPDLGEEAIKAALKSQNGGD